MYVLDRLHPAISALALSRNPPHEYLADARCIHNFRTEHARRNGSHRLREQACAFDTLALIHPQDKQVFRAPKYIAGSTDHRFFFVFRLH